MLANRQRSFTFVDKIGTLEWKCDNKSRELVKKLIEASKIMDDLFWYEAYGDKEALLGSIEDASMKEYVMINYGPWDRLNDNEPFMEGVDAKPVGEHDDVLLDDV